MLTKKRRLKKEEIQSVKDKGSFLGTPFFSLLYMKAKKGRSVPSKFAFVLSKKVSKKATERNRTKRILAGSVRSLIKEIQEEGYLVLFLVKKRAIGADRQVILDTISNAFLKIGLLKNEEYSTDLN